MYKDYDDIVTDFLQEVGTSNVKVSKQQKIGRLAGKNSIQLAKSKGDPLYKKYSKLKAGLIATKGKIAKKYGQKGKAAAKKSMI